MGKEVRKGSQIDEEGDDFVYILSSYKAFGDRNSVDGIPLWVVYFIDCKDKFELEPYRYG